MEQIDFSNSFYMEEAVIRSMLHVSHTTREEGPIIFFQIITEKERGSHNSDSGDSDDEAEEDECDDKEDDDSDDFCTGKPTEAVEPNLLSDASSEHMPDPIVLPLLPKIIFVVAIMTTMK